MNARPPARGVTAVVLCWNDEDRVRALLDALARQRPAAPSVVVVDNGSRGEAAARIADAYPAHRVVALPCNAGFATAVNRGIDEALRGQAEWVWLLNTDLELPPGALASLLAEASRDAACGMVGASLHHRDGRQQARGGGRVNLWTGMVRHATDGAPRCDYLSGACLLLRVAMLRQTGVFDERYFFSFEDVDLGYRARDAGWRMAVATDCRVLHDEATSLGAWSGQRWFHLFRGLRRLLASRSPAPRLALALRLVHHTATMAAHGRPAALRGAWRGALGLPAPRR